VCARKYPEEGILHERDDGMFRLYNFYKYDYLSGSFYLDVLKRVNP
jgi:hypothetical protein